jgi:hypothetical protein
MLSTGVRDRRVEIATALAAPRTAIIATAAVTALAVFMLGALLETWLISLLQPSEGELTWIGDLVLAGCLGVAIYRWLDLRLTRAALIELERAQISGTRVVIVTDGITERMVDFEKAVAAVDTTVIADDVCDAVFGLSDAPDAIQPVAGWDDDRTVVVLALN